MAGVGGAASCDAQACWDSCYLWSRHLSLPLLLLLVHSSSCHGVAAAAAAAAKRRTRRKRRHFYPLQLEEGPRDGRRDGQKGPATRAEAAKRPGEGVLS